MNGTPRALLIDPDDRSREVIRRALATTGRVAVSEASASYQGAVGLLGTGSYELVVIDLDHDREAALRLLRHAASLDPRMPVLPASADPDSSLVLAAMRAGAREFLVLPPDPGELTQILERLLSVPATGPTDARRGTGLIAVAGTVGGVGCTTIAVNLAVALAKRPEDSVLLADFDLLFGSVDVAAPTSLPDFHPARGDPADRTCRRGPSSVGPWPGTRPACRSSPAPSSSKTPPRSTPRRSGSS